MLKRPLAVLAAAVALGTLSVGTAQAAPADTAPCKSGGFANHVDPATGAPFKNQGRCVSFVNGGGALVPVEEEPSVPVAPTTKITLGSWEVATGDFQVWTEVQGQPNTTYDLVRTTAGLSGPSPVTTNADGLGSFTTSVRPETLFTVSYRDQVIGSVTTPAVLTEEPPATTPDGVTTYVTGAIYNEFSSTWLYGYDVKFVGLPANTEVGIRRVSPEAGSYNEVWTSNAEGVADHSMYYTGTCGWHYTFTASVDGRVVAVEEVPEHPACPAA